MTDRLLGFAGVCVLLTFVPGSTPRWWPAARSPAGRGPASRPHPGLRADRPRRPPGRGARV